LYITKDPAVGRVAEDAGVNWIFVDMEYRGKSDRQANRDTVISAHTLEDVLAMRQAITRSQLMVRINPWGEWSRQEVEDVVQTGADIIMLPFFTTAAEVSAFIRALQYASPLRLAMVTAPMLSVCLPSGNDALAMTSYVDADS
jgi:citrate lyase beta subunit